MFYFYNILNYYHIYLEDISKLNVINLQVKTICFMYDLFIPTIYFSDSFENKIT